MEVLGIWFWVRIVSIALIFLVGIGLIDKRARNTNLTALQQKRWKRIATGMHLTLMYLVTGYVWYVWMFQYDFMREFMWEWYIETIWATLTSWRMMLAGAAITVLSYAGVIQLKLTGRSWYRLRIGPRSKDLLPPENIATIATKMRYIGLSNLFILIATVPLLALVEEVIFRASPYWVVGPELRLVALIAVSIFLFGVVHLASGYDVATVIILAFVPALAFTLTFYFYGLNASTQLHIATNIIALPFYGTVDSGPKHMIRFLKRTRLIPQYAAADTT